MAKPSLGETYNSSKRVEWDSNPQGPLRARLISSEVPSPIGLPTQMWTSYSSRNALTSASVPKDRERFELTITNIQSVHYCFISLYLLFLFLKNEDNFKKVDKGVEISILSVLPLH